MSVRVTTTVGSPSEVLYEDAGSWFCSGDSVRILDTEGQIIAEFDRRAVMFIEFVKNP